MQLGLYKSLCMIAWCGTDEQKAEADGWRETLASLEGDGLKAKVAESFGEESMDYETALPTLNAFAEEAGMGPMPDDMEQITTMIKANIDTNEDGLISPEEWGKFYSLVMSGQLTMKIYAMATTATVNKPAAEGPVLSSFFADGEDFTAELETAGIPADWTPLWLSEEQKQTMMEDLKRECNLVAVAKSAGSEEGIDAMLDCTKEMAEKLGIELEYDDDGVPKVPE